jgi:hypothetical protein
MSLSLPSNFSNSTFFLEAIVVVFDVLGVGGAVDKVLVVVVKVLVVGVGGAVVTGFDLGGVLFVVIY